MGIRGGGLLNIWSCWEKGRGDIWSCGDWGGTILNIWSYGDKEGGGWLPKPFFVSVDVKT